LRATFSVNRSNEDVVPVLCSDRSFTRAAGLKR